MIGQKIFCFLSLMSYLLHFIYFYNRSFIFLINY
uniref:Uncharacterized protein n=1 Tax=Spyridia filamentosa TaxID=196632 RepID=A0A1Z1MK52_SPYFI|nr:hypothetical protein [Spyridia filamentosa]ARW66141.1 hypothetical protein [Spyridia filamentosa]